MVSLKSQLIVQVHKMLKPMFPALLGLIGGLAATMWPAYHAAFCAGLLGIAS